MCVAACEAQSCPPIHRTHLATISAPGAPLRHWHSVDAWKTHINKLTLPRNAKAFPLMYLLQIVLACCRHAGLSLDTFPRLLHDDPVKYCSPGICKVSGSRNSCEACKLPLQVTQAPIRGQNRLHGFCNLLGRG